MKTAGKTHGTGCPVAHGLDTFGDRWTLLVLRDMILHGKRRYGELLEAEEGIATNILADRLKHLEAEGLITRVRDPQNRRSYLYGLTEKGLSLMPVIFEIIKWSAAHFPLTATRKRLLQRINEDSAGLIREIRAREAANPLP
ncbi:MAG: helix-turn-helix transcriptional regulator [Rhodospirillales bacterium]|nr:helix-turn-helix transcriptional regulator [Rhodospirillales bacterium]MBO6788017.1 helix-turn-helix transcriptional regulator [Rhodospirillales bacterium]